MRKLLSTGLVLAGLLIGLGPSVLPAAAADSVEIQSVSVDSSGVIAPGKSVCFHVTVKVNEGQLLESRGDMLRNTDGKLYGHWPHIAVVGTVNAGQTYTFNCYSGMVAPTAEGIYESRWRVWRSGAWTGPEAVVSFRVSIGGSGRSVPNPYHDNTLCKSTAISEEWNVTQSDGTAKLEHFIVLTIPSGEVREDQKVQSLDSKLTLAAAALLAPVSGWAIQNHAGFSTGEHALLPRQWRIVVPSRLVGQLSANPPIAAPFRNTWLTHPEKMVNLRCDNQVTPTSPDQFLPVLKDWSIIAPIPGARYRVPFQMPDFMQWIQTSVRKGSNATVALVSPNGTVYSPTSSGVSYTDTASLAVHTLNLDVPQGGVWEVVVDVTAADEGSVFMLDVYGKQYNDPVVDNIPPVTGVTLSGTRGQNGWYVSPVNVTISAEDNPGGSGVRESEWSTDDGTTWHQYSGSFQISAEGLTNLLARSVDNAGNVELSTISKLFHIDRTAPITSLSLEGTPGQNGWYISVVSGSLSATDNLSGVDTTYYSIDGGGVVPGTSFVLDTEAVHTVSWYSTDAAGNVEQVRSASVKMDWTPPQTQAFVIGPKDVNGILRDNVVVAFVVYDNVAGKWYTEYAGIDGTGTWRRLYGVDDRFTIDQNGVFQFMYRSVDLAGNQERELDSGPLVISRWLVYCTGSDQCIQLSGNQNGTLTGDLFSNGSYSITSNIWQVVTGLLKSVAGGSTVAGNIYSTIPAIQSGASAVALGPYPVSYYLSRATRVYNSSTTFNSISDVLTGVIYVKGDVTLKTIKVSGNVVILAEGNIYDQSITNAFVSDDPANGITLYSMKDIRLKNIGSKIVGMVYAPTGSIIIDGPINFVLRGSLVARKVQIMNTHWFDARYDAAFQSGTFQLPLSSIANPPVGSGPTVTPVQPSATSTAAPASSTPTPVPASPTATRTPTQVPSPTSMATSTPTSAPPTATSVPGATATPCSGVQPPTLLLPANGSTVGTLRPTLSWQAASGAFYTMVQLSADPTFATGVTTYETIIGSYTPPANLQAHTTYYWRGRSRALIPATYTNCWSSVWTFTSP